MTTANNTLKCHRVRHARRQRNLFEPARRKHLRRPAVHFYPAHRLRFALLLLRLSLRLYRRAKNDFGGGCRGDPSARRTFRERHRFERLLVPFARTRFAKQRESLRQNCQTAPYRAHRRRTALATQFAPADEILLRCRFYSFARNQRRPRPRAEIGRASCRERV